MTQEAPHIEPITCNYSNPGRQRKAADTLCAQRMVASAHHQGLEQMPEDSRSGSPLQHYRPSKGSLSQDL